MKQPLRIVIIFLIIAVTQATVSWLLYRQVRDEMIERLSRERLDAVKNAWLHTKVVLERIQASPKQKLTEDDLTVAVADAFEQEAFRRFPVFLLDADAQIRLANLDFKKKFGLPGEEENWLNDKDREKLAKALSPETEYRRAFSFSGEMMRKANHLLLCAAKKPKLGEGDNAGEGCYLATFFDLSEIERSLDDFRLLLWMANASAFILFLVFLLVVIRHLRRYAFAQERIRFFEEMEKTRQYMGLVYTRSPNSIVLIKGDRIFDANPAFVLLTGYDIQALRALKASQVLTVDQISLEEPRRGSGKPDESDIIQPPASQDITVITRRGEKRRCVTNVISAASPSEPATLIIRDVTRERMLESSIQGYITRLEEANKRLVETYSRAEEANRLKSQFVANMSHELRTPLNSILGFASILKDELAEGKPREYIRIIYNNSKSLLGLINGVLDLSKIEAGRMEVRVTKFNIQEILDAAINAVRAQAQEKKLELKLDTAADLPPQFRGDSAKIQQVLINLLSNAVKFTDRGSVILRAERADEPRALRFQSVDTGCGIPKDKYEEVFEEFRQLDGSAQRTRMGTGLGLAITKKIINLLKGSISVESEIEKGTTMTVILPELPEVGNEGDRSSGSWLVGEK